MSIRAQLNAIAAERILILDGAMGSQIQALNLSEQDFRGSRFAGHHKPLAGCNDLLCLTKPEVIGAIHDAYLSAGADIIETCSFNATAVSLADYGLGDLAYEISVAAAAVARKSAGAFSDSTKPRFVAGSIGPTAKCASLSPDLMDLAKRGIDWDELETAYYDNARGLLDGGADILLVETIVDTLNAKAALFAIGRLMEERGIDIPVMISATVMGESGRLLAGQNLEAFYISVAHTKPWAIGLNCSFGAEKLLPHIRLLSDIAPCMISAYPNAGLPNQAGSYDETPVTMADHVAAYFKDGLVNIAGGCCGSTPAHIAAIAAEATAYKPRRVPDISPVGRLAGLVPVIPGSGNVIVIGENANTANNSDFARLIAAGEFADAADIIRDITEEGAAIVNIALDDTMPNADVTMGILLNHALSDPYIAKAAFMLTSSRWDVLESGLKRLQGKCLVHAINLQGGEREFLRQAKLVRRYGAMAVVTLIDEQGPAADHDRGIAIAKRAYILLTANAFPAENIVFDPGTVDRIPICSWIQDNCPGVLLV